MNIEEDLTSLKEIVAIRKERCHGFIDSDSCLISTKRLETLLTAYEKEKEANKKLDKEAQGYLEELVGDGSMNIRRIQELEAELEKEKEKNKKIENELKDTRSIFNMGRRSYKNEIEDKIKAKIESVDYGYHSKAERIAMKEVLQSLLEKE